MVNNIKTKPKPKPSKTRGEPIKSKIQIIEVDEQPYILYFN